MSGRARPSRPYLALGVLLLAVAPVWAVRPAGAGAESRGAPTQDGWWNRLQGPAEGEPEGNPLRPLIPAVPQPPNVPADAIATSAGGGQVDKIAAVGIDVVLGDGATLDGLTLQLKEAAGGGANLGADTAKVTACPATIPWGPNQNAAWRDRPTADCGLGAADGVRAADGTWTFDLTAIGRLWSDPFAPLAPDGVVLWADPSASSSPVQVSWLNFDSGNVVVELAATPGAPVPAVDGGVTATNVSAAESPVPAVVPYADGPGDSRAFPAARGGVSADPFAYSSGEHLAAVTPSAADTSDPAAASGSPAEAALAAAPGPSDPARIRPAVGFWERVPAPTALLVPVAAGLAILIGVVLGPVGRPSPVFRREGGLSRALARRSRDLA